MRKILFSLTALTLFVTGILIVIIFNSSPIDAQKTVIPMFFTFLFLSILLIVFLVSLSVILKKKIKPNKVMIIRNLRRSAMFSLCVVALGLLSAYGVLNALSGITSVLAIFLIDLFIENKTRERTVYE